MTAPQILDSQMAERTNEELLEMFERREDWFPEALEAARVELQRRGIEIKPEEKEEEPRASRLLSFKSQAAIGIVPGIIMQFFGQALRDHARGQGLLIVALVLSVAGYVSFIWGCVGYSAGKGYTKWLGALGLLSCLGLLVLVVLPDRRKGCDDHTS